MLPDIGQAVGLLMADQRLNEEAAFEVLVRRSADANLKLRNLAAAMVSEANRTGDPLPPVADY